MPIVFRVAHAAPEKDRVFRLRYQVFVTEEQRFTCAGERVLDRFDAFEETSLVLAEEDGVPVGTVRITIDNQAGLPALEYYDFRPFLAGVQGRIASVGWLCVAQTHRKHRGLIMGLFKMVAHEARRRGARHIIAPLHPGVLPLLEHIGARKLAEEFISPELNVPMVPIHIDMDRFPTGIREFMQDPLHIIFDESNERRVYRKGEEVVRRGAPGHEAFLIMRGSALVRTGEPAPTATPADRRGAAPNRDGILLGPGQIFGELSLLDGGPRTATVLAHARELDVMVWTQEEFLAQLREDRQRAFEICRILGARLRGQLEGRQRPAPEEALLARIVLEASREGADPVDSPWLAAQCGLWPDELVIRLAPWREQGWIAVSDTNELRILDAAALQARISKG